MKKRCCFIIALVISFLFQAMPVLSETSTAAGGKTATPGENLYVKEETYREYLKKNSTVSFTPEELVIEAASFSKASDDANVKVIESFENEKNVLLWQNLGGTVEYTVTVPQDSLYCVKLKYFILSDDSRNTELGLQIDGKYPFIAASDMTLPRLFSTKENIVADQRGNDIRPSFEGVRSWMESSFRDNSGLYNSPYYFHLTAGVHNLSLTGVKAGLAIREIRLYAPEKPVSYKNYSMNAVLSKNTQTVFVEGEKPLYTSDSVLYPVYDRSGPDTSPSDPVKLKMNTIGQSNWSMQGQTITWNAHVPETGYYKIGIRYQQNLMRNLTSYRRLYINGQVPFDEANAVPFSFADQWQYMELGGGWLFHLNKGDNTIALEAVPGPVGDIIAELENTIYEMNTLYRKIIMITGVNADANRDYQLEKEIPGLTGSFVNIKKSCESAVESLTAINKKNTAATTSALNSIIIQCDSFIKKPDTIAVRIARLKDNISSLSSLLINLKNQPLEIDYLSVGTTSPLFYPRKNMGEKILFDANAFLGSFFEDYTSIGVQYTGSAPVKVWINLGRDQTQVIKTMTDSIFTPKTGIPVNISLVQQSLIQASLSNKGPDVVVFVGQSDPVNLAARNALQNLSEYKDLDAVLTDFNPYASVPYQFNGGMYALPVTEDFMMMYYRKDIFEELKLTPPATWDDFYKVLSILQRNNMTAGIPNMPPDSQMATNTSIFAMLIKQNGGTYLKDDLSQTLFDSSVSVEAFKMWTGFYSSYGIPYQYDFYNRFRTGEMPIGLDSYTLFNKLSIGAPEIKGLWEMAPIPGTVTENGKINNQSCAAGSCMIMLKKSQNKKSAWEFMKWFVSDGVQAGYGLQIESLLGASGRYSTANQKAFEKLPWSAKEQQLIKSQWKNIFELPQVPGGYFIDRNLTNAFRKVVFLNKNPRETLLDYNKEINLEIRRKRIEFGLEKE